MLITKYRIIPPAPRIQSIDQKIIIIITITWSAQGRMFDSHSEELIIVEGSWRERTGWDRGCVRDQTVGKQTLNNSHPEDPADPLMGVMSPPPSCLHLAPGTV
jgi:hypothetical protein